MEIIIRRGFSNSFCVANQDDGYFVIGVGARDDIINIFQWANRIYKNERSNIELGGSLYE